MSEYQHPSEIVNLPSEGKFYPESSPLHSGTVDLKYPTAKEEDILTSTNLIQKNIVFDVLMKNLILTKDVDVDDLLVGDFNAILIAARVLAYGKNYPIVWNCGSCGHSQTSDVDLTSLETISPSSKINDDQTVSILVNDGLTVDIKLLTRRDEKAIQKEVESIEEHNLQPTLVTSRLKAIIVSVNGDKKRATINDFVDNLLIKNSRYIREEYSKVAPDVDYSLELKCKSCGALDRRNLVIGQDFFWPELKI